jgi:hypothetical protein
MLNSGCGIGLHRQWGRSLRAPWGSRHSSNHTCSAKLRMLELCKENVLQYNVCFEIWIWNCCFHHSVVPHTGNVAAKVVRLVLLPFMKNNKRYRYFGPWLSLFLFCSMSRELACYTNPQPGGPGNFWSRFSSSSPWYASIKLQGSSSSFGPPWVFYFPEL